MDQYNDIRGFGDNDANYWWTTQNEVAAQQSEALFEATGGVPEGGFGAVTGIESPIKRKKARAALSEGSKKDFSLKDNTGSGSLREGFVTTSQARTGRTGQLTAPASVNPLEFQRKWLQITEQFAKIKRETS